MTGGPTNFGTITNYATEPYCSVLSFRAAPTFLDSTNLIPGGAQSKQDAELFNVLMRASAWCDIFTGGTTQNPYLGASSVTENMRIRANRFGELSIHPAESPVQQVTALSLGFDPSALGAVSATNLAQIWIEDNRQIFIPVPAAGLFNGLQFGSTTAPEGLTFVNITYTAGYFNSTLASGTYSSGSSSVTVNNPTGLIPGTSFRINDPAAEEVVTVAASYTTGSATVPLVNPLLFSHTGTTLSTPGTAVGCSALPLAIQTACIAYSVGLLLREDVSSEAPFADTTFGPAARRASTEKGASSGLISEAERLLRPFMRTR